jgi:hypothetical protein
VRQSFAAIFLASTLIASAPVPTLAAAFVKAVPISEQNYQGGVLSRFYQLNNIQVGDEYGVRFVE